MSRSPESRLYTRQVRRPHAWAGEDTVDVNPGGGVKIAGGNAMKGSNGAGRADRYEKQAVGYSSVLKDLD